MKIECPECKNTEFEENEPAYPGDKPISTVCTKCKTSYFIRELKANWRRWGSKEHTEWCRNWLSWESKR